MKETNRCFAAAFKHSHYDNLDDYKEYLRLRDKCKEYFIKNLGIIENYRMFIKHYTLTNFEDFKIDATKYMNDCNIIMKYFGNLDLLGTIKRNISRYFPNMSIEEYCVEFKKMLDLQNFVKDKYNHEYDNFHKQVWRYWNKMNLITPMIGIIIDLLSYLNYVKKY